MENDKLIKELDDYCKELGCDCNGQCTCPDNKEYMAIKTASEQNLENQNEDFEAEPKRYLVQIQMSADDWDQQEFDDIAQAVDAFRQLKDDRYSELVDTKTEEILLKNGEIENLPEDLAATKQVIDDMVADKENPEKINTVVKYMSDNNQSEEKMAQEYMYDKMKQN